MQSAFRKLVIAATFSLPIAVIGAQSAFAETLNFGLSNRYSSPLVEFQVDPSSQKTWGENILSGTIAPGEDGSVMIADGLRTCKYDIRGVFANGEVVEEIGLNLCELGSYTYK
ncbi:MAG TPA: hypothetical protein V6D18_13615 [Thermosynechococcaceae cyanobacterium]